MRLTTADLPGIPNVADVLLDLIFGGCNQNLVAFLVFGVVWPLPIQVVDEDWQF